MSSRNLTFLVDIRNSDQKVAQTAWKLALTQSRQWGHQAGTNPGWAGWALRAKENQRLCTKIGSQVKLRSQDSNWALKTRTTKDWIIKLGDQHRAQIGPF